MAELLKMIQANRINCSIAGGSDAVVIIWRVKNKMLFLNQMIKYLLSVKDAIPKGKSSELSVHKAEGVRTKKEIFRDDGSKVKDTQML